MLTNDRALMSLADAARALGVHPATLRRWADNGDIAYMLTPGGHRRFARADIERFAATRPNAGGQMLPGAFVDQAITHTRESLPAEQKAHWQTALEPGTRERHRELGRALLGLTLQYVATDDGAPVLDQARAVGREYGRISRAAGMSLADALHAALFFRDRLLEAALTAPAGTRARPHDQGRILLRINALLNAVQLAAVEEYGATS